jgi:hypothetical protein
MLAEQIGYKGNKCLNIILEGRKKGKEGRKERKGRKEGRKVGRLLMHLERL